MILKIKVTMTKSKVKSRPHLDIRDMALKIFKVKVNTERSKVTSRSHHDAAHLCRLINMSTKCQPSTPYSFQDIDQTKF